MQYGGTWLEEGDTAAELFLELAMERLLRGFARVYFPAGEFPETGEGLAWRPLGQEYLPVIPPDDGTDDLKGLGGGYHIFFADVGLGQGIIRGCALRKSNSC